MPVLNFKHSADLVIKDYAESGAIPFVATYETLEPGSLGDLSLGLVNDGQTRVRATFTGDFTSHADWPFDLYGIIEIDVEGTGGINFIRQISTELDYSVDNVWEGLSGDKALLTINTSPDFVTVEALLDISELESTATSFKLSGRLGRKGEETTFCLLQEDGFDILLENEDGCIEIEY